MSKFIPMEECIKGKIYRLDSRNLSYGVYDGHGGFIGIRCKFGDRFLFTEYHWDTGEPYGTVKPREEVGSLPRNIPVAEDLSTECTRCRREVVFVRPSAEKTSGEELGWFYREGDSILEKSQHLMEDGVFPRLIPNTKLFKYLEDFDK